MAARLAFRRAGIRRTRVSILAKLGQDRTLQAAVTN
ncbi:hypothetical protein COLO4_13024 [Corchorus olitorius]|uniref:Uncharacterized protein n=1 Tax=Corchorus olitorius TaxID=93759 RepID=A0A1R3JYK6_9ROSI|nr:hypothetical protein COLO4_13024 [Corchorus olitorius]